MKINVYCDNCDWKKERQDINNWFNIPCPKCRESIIVNKADMIYYRRLRFLIFVSDMLALFFPRMPKKKHYVDSSFFRRKRCTRTEWIPQGAPLAK